MGAQISSNKLQSSQQINDLLLKLSINGPLQDNVSNRKIAVAIDGFLMEKDVEVKSPTKTVIKNFKDFVATPEFKEYLQNSLFLRSTTKVEGFSYEIPVTTLQNLTWEVEGTPELSYENDSFQVTFTLFMRDDEKEEHKFSRAVAFVGKSLVAALKLKRAELIPPLKTKSFAPTHVSFSL